jgi:diguanylate cyclase (GGDEF)-like protein
MLFASLEQTQNAMAQLEQAMYNHEQWYKALPRTLVSHLPPDAADVDTDAHRSCRFGQWYYSAATAPLMEHPGFVALGGEHEQMHRLAAALLVQNAEGTPVPANDFDRFSNTLERARLEMQSLHKELETTLQNRDPLTGARNRSGMLTDLREQHALVKRGVQPSTLAMLDLDHFMRVNDTHGHVVGDRVLFATAVCVQQHLRPYDRLYRFGGEEFLLCLPNTAVIQAMDIVERLRQAIAANSIQMESVPALLVTASFGVAELEDGVQLEKCIDRADKALYLAKRAGRNCSRAWAPETGA